MKKAFAILSIAVASLAAVSKSQSGGTYTQTNHACLINECKDAQFSPVATLSYYNSIRFYSNHTFSGTAIWNGTEYTDFTGTFTWLGYGNHYPLGTWELKGTFDEGHSIVTEDWHCFRSCSAGDNVSGSVVQN
jgi:hypothetical protein